MIWRNTSLFQALSLVFSVARPSVTQVKSSEMRTSQETAKDRNQPITSLTNRSSALQWTYAQFLHKQNWFLFANKIVV